MEWFERRGLCAYMLRVEPLDTHFAVTLPLTVTVTLTVTIVVSAPVSVAGAGAGVGSVCANSCRSATIAWGLMWQRGDARQIRRCSSGEP